MVRFLADENFDGRIVRGLRRRSARIDILRVQDVGLGEADDPTVLEWAANESRLLLTHDVSTVTAYAYERVGTGRPMPGVVEVRRSLPIGQAIEEVLLLAEASQEKEWEGRVIYVPL